MELPSCLPTDRATDRVTMAIWKYGEKKLTDKNKIFHENQFKGRLELNHQNFSLTVKRLTLQDSGNFSFVSDVNDKQRETVIISLQVHGRILPFFVKHCELKKNQMCSFIVCKKHKMPLLHSGDYQFIPQNKNQLIVKLTFPESCVTP